MAKYISIIVALLCLGLFNSCVDKELQQDNVPVTSAAEASKTSEAKQADPERPVAYGAYLAGRVAHLRKDFNNAADFYIVSLQEDSANKELLSRVYIILASEGRIPEAAEYAQSSLKQGDTNNFIHIIMATDYMVAGKHQQALDSLNKMKGAVYEEFITPLMASWVYAGMGQSEQALKTVDISKKEPNFKSLYHIQAGMLNDYLGNIKEAQKHYEVIVNEESTEMSFRTLQIIANFYIRNGQKDKAVKLVNKYNDDRLFVDMLKNLASNVANADPKTTKPILESANIGFSESLFSIASNMRQLSSGTDIAHIFICLSIYSNPKYDIGRLLLADILESREMYAEANAVYDEISPSSESYNSIQIKKAANYVMLQDYKAAEILLTSLAEDNPNSFQINMDLGDILRINGKYKEAVAYYSKAISSIKREDSNTWVLYYARGIAYEQSGNWKKAEADLKAALEKSQNHYYVQNYLGYSWLKRKENIENAFTLIVDAYNQSPEDGHITDSLGWAFYQLGDYENAVTYLEKASEAEPANALISAHLGDAYWQVGRKNEAIFQWKHTLKMTDDSGEVDMKEIEQKISSGMKRATPLPYNPELIQDTLSSLSADEE